MRIGLLDARLVLPPPPPLLPPHAATTSDAVATSAGALHRSLLIALLLRPLQTFAAIDCDRRRQGAGLSSATRLTGAPRSTRGARTSGPAGRERGAQPALRRAGPVAGQLPEQDLRRRAADLPMRDAHRGQRRVEPVGERHVVEAHH